MNPAFKRFFSCTDAVLGRHVSYLMDPAPFEKLISGITDTLDITVSHRHYNLLTRELLYMLKEERQIVGIFINITSQEEQEKTAQRNTFPDCCPGKRASGTPVENGPNHCPVSWRKHCQRRRTGKKTYDLK